LLFLKAILFGEGVLIAMYANLLLTGQEGPQAFHKSQWHIFLLA